MVVFEVILLTDCNFLNKSIALDIFLLGNWITTLFSKYKSVKFGNNVLIGKNVKIGKNTMIGSNSIIEQNVVIGKDVVIGSNVIVKNSIIGDRVVMQDNCKLGQKGFGFIPLKEKNLIRLLSIKLKLQSPKISIKDVLHLEVVISKI